MSKDLTKAKFKRFDFCIKFSPKLTDAQLEYITALLDKQKIRNLVVKDPKLSPTTHIFIDVDSPEAIVREAENQSIYKELSSKAASEKKDSLISRLKEGSQSQQYKYHQHQQVQELEKYKPFTFEKRHLFLSEVEGGKQDKSPEPKETPKTETEGEKAAPTGKKPALKDLIQKNMMPEKAQAPSKSGEPEDFSRYLSLFTPAELIRIKYSILEKLKIDKTDAKYKSLFDPEGTMASYPAEGLFENLIGLGVIEYVSALHNRRQLEKVTTDPKSLNNYYGEEITMYFEYMKHYRTWLRFPALLGVADYALKHLPVFSQWASVYDDVYALLTVVWATLYVIHWGRTSSELTTKWHSYSKYQRLADRRPEFKGKTRINPITELPELYHPKKQLYFHYLVSLLYTVPLLLVAGLVVVVCLNMSAYTTESTSIYMPYFAKMAQKGGIFEVGTIGYYIPTVLQVIGIAYINGIYQKVSYRRTVAENHMMKSDFDNALIVKRFAFMFISYFLYLLYIAFWRFDIQALKTELVTIYIVDEFRRVATEAVIPYVLKSHKIKKMNEENPDLPDEERLNKFIKSKIVEMASPSFESFVEYIEMIFQFGYVSLFACIFPLAGPLSVLFNHVEMASDFWKIKTSYRRPLPKKSGGIGTWFYILQAITVIAVTSNAILACIGDYSVKKIESYGKVEYENLKESVSHLFVYEHFVLLIVVFLWAVIPSVPKWVEIYRKRKKSTVKVF